MANKEGLYVIRGKSRYITYIYRGGDCMDFIDKLKHFSNRVSNLNEQIAAEEATKTSLAATPAPMIKKRIIKR